MYAPCAARAIWKARHRLDAHAPRADLRHHVRRRHSWERKKDWTDRAVRYYLDANAEVAFSPAPLEYTMRRAGVMMKPCSTVFRNVYPRSNNLFYAAPGGIR